MRGVVLAIMLATACASSQASRIHHDTEEILLVGEDLVLRRELDNTVTAIATRVLADTTGTGAVRLRTRDLQEAARSPHIRFARARAFQALAMKLVADHGASFDAAMLGIKELGDQYAPPRIIDDTSLRFLPARDQRDNPERLPFAAESLRKVLRSRLNMYARRYSADLL